MKPPTKAEAEAEAEAAAKAKVRSWGFSHVFVWTDRPGAYYAPHSHAGLTTHVILRGQLSIAYPRDGDGDGDGDRDAEQRTVYGEGERLDVEAGRVHEVWVGGAGCTYVVGDVAE